MGNIIPGTALSLECVGRILGNDPGRILDGRTATNPASVGLATSDLEPFTGARWLALPAPDPPSTNVFLQCLGDVDGPRFLDGHTQDGTVGLAPNTEDPFTGTRWEISDAGSDEVFLRCLGASTEGANVRFLRGNLGDGTVELVQQGGDVSSATRWRVIDAQPAPNGGPGVTSATSSNAPVLWGGGVIPVPGFPLFMAWRALDGRVSVMTNLLTTPTLTVALAHLCVDRPALTAHSDGKVYLTWTAPDQSMHLMSSDDGLVYSGLVTLPGRSVFGPAITSFQDRLIVAWIDAPSGRLLMMNGLDAPVFDSKETSIAAPAVATDGDVLALSWTGSNALRQLNVLVGDDFPPEILFTLPSDGSGAGTSFAGPSLAFKALDSQGFADLVIGWTGLPGGPNHDHHLNTIHGTIDAFSRGFGNRRTVTTVSDVGPAIVNLSPDPNAPTTNLLAAWTDRQSRINTAFYDSLPVIPA
jgi:hypothetical protein